jgi:prephenate dehydrogenase
MGTLAIIGLGLIGGSMGLALKRAEPEKTEVIGYERDPERAVQAHRAGAVQRLAPSAAAAAAEANLVIIATPIINVRKVFEEIAPVLKPGTIVTDTASTKAEVERWARDTLPAGVHFVGGHPMAGKEQTGPAAAEAALFDERPYCIVPGVMASGGAVEQVVSLAEAVGARPFFLDADEHDAYAAAISHVPLAVSVALFNLARGSAAWPELANMAGPGFRDLTRLTSGSPEMAHDIFLTNRSHVSHWLERYISELQRLAALIHTEESEPLFRFLAEAQIERDNYLENPPKREEPNAGGDVELPSSGTAFVNMMAGELWQQRAKDITDTLETRQRERAREDRLHRRED